MPNSRFGYSVKKNSFKGLNIDCIQYSNIIRITHYSYSYSGTILNPNIIRIRIRPNICARILFVLIFAHSEKTNIIRIRIWSKKQYSLTSVSYRARERGQILNCYSHQTNQISQIIQVSKTSGSLGGTRAR